MSTNDIPEVLFELERSYYDPAQLRSTLRDRAADEEERAHLERIIREGTVVTYPDFEPLPGPAAKRLRLRLLGTFEGRLPERGWISGGGQGRDLIPGLWRFGHIPMLSGQPRAGKSSFVADLLASLVTPGRRFLDHYPPAELADEERRRGILLINAENPTAEQRAALEATGLVLMGEGGEIPGDDFEGPAWYFPSEYSHRDDYFLTVENLEELGGASIFDLRVAANFDLWLDRLVECRTCNGLDDESPLVIVVDGLTAILGSDTAAYGQWYAAFRLLMREIDCPNALVVTHSPKSGGGPMQGVESEAQADGTWILETTSSDPRAPRRFHGARRLIEGGIEGGRIHLEDGRLRLVPKGASSSAASAAESPEIDPHEADLLEQLTAAGEAGVAATELTGSGRVGQQRRELLKRLESEGRIHSVPEGRSVRWHLGEQSGT